MKNLLFVTILVAIMLITTGNARSYTIGAEWTWQPGDPNYNATIVPRSGTISTSGFTFGDFLGWTEDKTESDGWGSSGAESPNPWDDNYVAWTGDGNTNGDALDGLWLWIFSEGGWWDLGSPFDKVAVFTSQDHGAYLAEGLEYRVFGSNTLWSDTVSSEAQIIDVYLDGWRSHDDNEDVNGNGWLSDDITGVFQLDSGYRYIKLAAWSEFGNPDELYEPEIDAVAGIPIPEPSTFLLLGGGLVGLAFVVRRRRKE